MEQRRTLFFLNTFNDIDHISPIIWKVLVEGNKAFIIFTSDYDYENDYRILFLQKNPNLKIYKFSLAYKNSFFSKIIREICYNRYYCTSFLKKLKINACVFEWDEIGVDLNCSFNAQPSRRSECCRSNCTFKCPSVCRGSS